MDHFCHLVVIYCIRKIVTKAASKVSQSDFEIYYEWLRCLALMSVDSDKRLSP